MKFSDFPISALMEITARPPIVFVRGEGSWLWDHTGKRYLDFVQGWAVNCLELWNTAARSARPAWALSSFPSRTDA